MPENYTNIYQSARGTTRYTQEQAAELLDISVESVKAYENDLRLPPNLTVVRMAQIYNAPWLALEHLAATAAPLGVLPEVRVQGLPTAVISLINRAADFRDHHRQLLRIAEDGVIDESERALFEDITGELEELISAALSVIYPMEAQKKTAPTCEGTSKRFGPRISPRNDCKNIIAHQVQIAQEIFPREGGEIL